MIQPPNQRTSAVHYVPGRLDIVAAFATSMVGWLLVIGALVEISLITASLGWVAASYLLLLFASPQIAIAATRRLISSRRIVASMPASVLARRCHGNLAAITDSERRPLRPIGQAADDVAVRSDLLLTSLLANPSVRLLRGVATGGATVPPIMHAISGGRTVILVESVAWPPGTYRIDQHGKVTCGGRCIGQSVRPLLAAVRRWRRVLPRRHRVEALVIVHPTATGEYQLPPPAPGVAWTTADDAIRYLQRLIPRGRPTVSRYTLATLISATADHAVLEARDRRGDLPTVTVAAGKGLGRYLWPTGS